jgi:hypothetical protein
MRAFRDRLKRIVVVWQAAAVVLPLTAAAAADQSYFPLAVGNAWTYACSTEGEWQFDRTLSLVSVQNIDGHSYFQAELKMSSDAKPLLTYVFSDDDGKVYTATEPSGKSATLLIPADPRVGDAVGDRIVGAIAKTTTPALGDADAIRIENFAADDPGISEERRLEWEGKYYVRGVGLAIDADGLGGECVLSNVHLVRP